MSSDAKSNNNNDPMQQITMEQLQRGNLPQWISAARQRLVDQGVILPQQTQAQQRELDEQYRVPSVSASRREPPIPYPVALPESPVMEMFKKVLHMTSTDDHEMTYKLRLLSECLIQELAHLDYDVAKLLSMAFDSSEKTYMMFLMAISGHVTCLDLISLLTKDGYGTAMLAEDMYMFEYQIFSSQYVGFVARAVEYDSDEMTPARQVLKNVIKFFRYHPSCISTILQMLVSSTKGSWKVMLDYVTLAKTVIVDDGSNTEIYHATRLICTHFEALGLLDFIGVTLANIIHVMIKPRTGSEITYNEPIWFVDFVRQVRARMRLQQQAATAAAIATTVRRMGPIEEPDARFVAETSSDEEEEDSEMDDSPASVILTRVQQQLATTATSITNTMAAIQTASNNNVDGLPLAEPVESPQSEHNDVTLCRICYTRPRTLAIQPCGHFFMCQPCYSRAIERDTRCPLCRDPIASVTTVRFS